MVTGGSGNGRYYSTDPREEVRTSRSACYRHSNLRRGLVAGAIFSTPFLIGAALYLAAGGAAP